MEAVQLDLFEIAEQNARTALSQSNPDPESLKLGDKVHVVWNNGVQFDGICTGLRGFWDGRKEFERWHWVLRYNIKHSRDNTYRSDCGYSHFDPHRDEWLYIGRDETFRVPDPAMVKYKLVECIKDVPFPKRLAVYQGFENDYPKLSRDYSKFVSDAWYDAIEEVTTIKEFIAAEKEWTCKLDMPSEAVQHIKDVVFMAPAEERLNLIKRMRWVDNEYKLSDRFCVRFLEQRDFTYYKRLYRKFIREAETPSQLVTVVRMRGGDSNWIDGKPSAKFWVED